MKKVVAVLLVVLMVLSFLQVAPGKDVVKADSQPIWPMYHYNAQHTGQCLYDTLKNNGTLKWKYETGSQIWSSPAIASDGTIYVGANDGYLYALNPDGTLKWKFKTGDSIYFSPAIGLDGTIYIGSEDHYFYAIKPNGTIKWKFEVDKPTSPAVAHDGTIYIGSNDGCLYAIGTDSNTSNPSSESNVSTQTTIVLQIGNPNITVNGKERPIDEQGSKPIIKNGRTLVPIRAIVEALGGTIEWDGTEQKVTIALLSSFFESTTIELWIGQSIANVNSVDTLIDSTNSEVVPEIIEGRTMLPLRFVAENLGCDVQWDGTTKTITITYPKS